MQRQDMMGTGSMDWRRLAWLVLLVAASMAFTLGFACAVPFAAFGAAVALTLPRRDALMAVGGVWLANQLVGFVLLSYPWTGDAFAWGLILGGVAVLSTLAPQAVMRRLAGQNPVVVAVASFAAAFVVYEGVLYLVSVAVMGGAEIYDFATIFRILEINAAAFAGLVALSRLGTVVSPSVTPVLARS